jgi:NAD(P)-dependent dehydrogenase (short-subunit alcohol dehydrogenase family)
MSSEATLHRGFGGPDGGGRPTCLVTGATSGLGLATAVALAGRGLAVVGVGRDRERCRAAEARVRAAGDPGCRYLTADLASLAELRRVAREVGDCPLAVLVNNVGAMFRTRAVTVDGFERTFALNHLAPFLLTNLLLERLRTAAPSRVVNLASAAHEGVELDGADLQATTYSRTGWPEYQRSKLATLLFTLELHRRLAGSGVTVNAVHPGVVATGFARSAGVGILRRLLIRLRGVGLEAGIATVVHLATAPEVAGMSGLYWVDRRPVTPSPAACDPVAARRLWDLSCELTGLRA